MTFDLAPVVSLVQSWLEVNLLVFLRVTGLMIMLPVLGERSVPTRVKIAITLALTMVVGSAIPNIDQEASEKDFLSAFPAEILVGFILGFGFRLFFLALHVAGTIAAQSTSLSQIFGSSQNMDPQAAIGNVLLVTGLALFVMFGLHIRAVEFLVGSYQVFPLGAWPQSYELSTWGISRVAHSFSLGFSLAAPFFVGSLIYNIALGAINRAMPQLMVAMVGAPVITAGGMILLALVSPLLFQVWLASLSAFATNPFGAP